MWDLPGPGLKPMSSALAGGFLTSTPPGKSLNDYLNHASYFIIIFIFLIEVLLIYKMLVSGLQHSASKFYRLYSI